MEYEITDLVAASRPAGATEDWWQMQTVLNSFDTSNEDEAVLWLDSDLDGEEADLSTYGRIGWQLVATRHGDCGGTALWVSLENRVE